MRQGQKMKYGELQQVLQNLTNTKISLAKIGEVLGETRQTMHRRASIVKGDVPERELTLLEQAFNIKFPKDLLIDKIKVEYYPDVLGSCGTGVFVQSQEKEVIEVPKEAFWIKVSPIKTYSMINAYGDSMYPIIFDKDKLLIEKYEGEQIIDNRIYVFCYQNEIFIKRLAKNINQLMIMSENKDFDTIKLQKEELKEVNIIGQVVGLIRNLK